MIVEGYIGDVKAINVREVLNRHEIANASRIAGGIIKGDVIELTTDQFLMEDLKDIGIIVCY